MKKITVLVFSSFLMCSSLHAQLLKTLGDKAKSKIGQRANQKVDNAMDKGLDKVEEGTKVKRDDDGDVKIKEADGTKTKIEADGDVKIKNPNGTKEKGTSSSLAYSSKYDFVPGEKVVAFEDFINANVGDFPTRWNTNATAEVVTLNNKEGKWLKINKEGVWMPEFISNLPENFTLEFDLGVSNDFDGSSFVINIANLRNRDKDYKDFYHNVNWRHGHALHLQFKPANGRTAAYARLQTATDGNYLVDNTSEFKVWDNAKNNFAHISLWRQAQRLRVYLNGEKLFDIPKAFEASGKYNTATFAMQGSYKPDEYYYLLGNVRLAVGAADTRNMLLNNGMFVTRGILFNTNSDKIKPESAGVLKEISNAIKEIPGVKVEIVGHTDSDGDEKANLELSKRRAQAVKTYLVTEFGLDGQYLQTNGRGEEGPLDKNTTPEGKANNRRVEFYKK